MIKPITFDSVHLLSFDERNAIVINFFNNKKSIEQLSVELGVDKNIINAFISDYENRLRNKT